MIKIIRVQKANILKNSHSFCGNPLRENLNEILEEVIENARTSFEIEGVTLSDCDWTKTKKTHELLKMVI